MLTADKAYWQDAFTTERLRWWMERVGIAKKCNRTERQHAYELSSHFRLVQDSRAGVEDSISLLGRTLGLCPCMNKSLNHFVSTVASRVFSLPGYGRANTRIFIC